jgi:ribosomal protein L7/L12
MFELFKAAVISRRNAETTYAKSAVASAEAAMRADISRAEDEKRRKSIEKAGSKRKR